MSLDAAEGQFGYSGIPYSEVQLWLDNVQSQLGRVRGHIERLQAEQAKLHDQENLLLELLSTTSGDAE